MRRREGDGGGKGRGNIEAIALMSCLEICEPVSIFHFVDSDSLLRRLGRFGMLEHPRHLSP